MHNAREALEEKDVKSPYIKISLFKENDINKVTIEDNAGGIALNNINKVFEAYFTTKPKSGTGIGLYMSRVIIVENFLGHLHVKNTPTGALFTIEVPMIG